MHHCRQDTHQGGNPLLLPSDSVHCTQEGLAQPALQLTPPGGRGGSRSAGAPVRMACMVATASQAPATREGTCSVAIGFSQGFRGTCADGLHGRDGLHRAGRAEQVPDHRLGAVDAHVRAGQRRPDRPVLRQVARLDRKQVTDYCCRLKRQFFFSALRQMSSWGSGAAGPFQDTQPHCRCMPCDLLTAGMCCQIVCADGDADACATDTQVQTMAAAR